MVKYFDKGTLFGVIVPVIATYSDAEIEQFGYRVETINGEENLPNFMNPTRIKVNLNRIIDIYSRGYSIQVTDPNDVTKIYNLLEDFISRSNTGPNLNRDIHDERSIEEIDKFANELFGLNRATILKSSVNVSNAFGIGFTPMHAPTIDYSQTPTVGDMSTRYGKFDNIQNTTYQTNIPNIDFDSVKQKTIYTTIE